MNRESRSPDFSIRHSGRGQEMKSTSISLRHGTGKWDDSERRRELIGAFSEPKVYAIAESNEIYRNEL